MKKLQIIIAVLAGILFFTACEELDQEPVLDLDQALAPAFTSPGDGGTYELLQDEAENDFATFSWSEADYGFQASVTYILQMDYADSSFNNPIQLASTQQTSLTMTVDEFNSLLLKDGVQAGVPHNFQFRVKSRLNENVEDLMTGVLSLTITAFEDEAPPLYMLGDATRVGWDNVNPVELISLGEGVYEVIDSLKAGGYYKFIPTPGQWAPQYGTDGTGTWDAGNLVLRPTENDPDPAALEAPPADGIYRITVDVNNLTYTVEETGLFILGDATTAGWSADDALPMALVEAYVFTLTTDLAADANYKFITDPGNWAPMYGAVDGENEEEGELIYRPTEGDPDPPAIHNITAGTKTITCDLKNLTYTVTTQK